LDEIKRYVQEKYVKKRFANPAEPNPVLGLKNGGSAGKVEVAEGGEGAGESAGCAGEGCAGEDFDNALGRLVCWVFEFAESQRSASRTSAPCHMKTPTQPHQTTST
jgi:hypothetical protein